MSRIGKVYIPRRIYEKLRTIYSSRVTVVAAEEGSGRSTFLSEYILRSRKNGISCRFIHECTDADDCFGQLCRIVTGKKYHIPISEAEMNTLKKALSSASPAKETIVILDNRYAAEMLFSPLRVTKLAAEDFPVKIVVSAPPLDEYCREICSRFGFSVIDGDALRLTRCEVREYFEFCGVESNDYEKIYRMTGGRMMELHLSLLLTEQGLALPESGDKLLDAVISYATDPNERGALLAALSFPTLDSEYCRDLASSEILTNYYGRGTFSPDNIFDLIDRLFERTRLVALNRKTRRVYCHPALFKYTLERFDTLRKDIQREYRNALARHFLRIGNTYYAFVNFSLAGEYEPAAECPSHTRVSFSLLLRSRDTLMRFVQSCPLSCKAIVPRYLRIIALLMLTDKRCELLSKFDEAEEYILNSKDYTRAEKRSICSYINTLKTYQDFFIIEKMGGHIKLAYDLYDGSQAATPPFYSWNLYTPSVFALIHRYSMPIEAESEQFLRYHRMYSEMIGHGEHICELYSAETFFYTGELEQASALSEAGLAECTEERNLPTRISFLFLAAKTALFLGEYRKFEEHINSIGEIMHRERTNEIGTMAAVCAAELSVFLGTIEENGSFLRFLSIDINRHQAPFLYFLMCVMDLFEGKFSELLEKSERCLAAAEEVRSETVIIKMLFLFAEAAALTGDRQRAAEYALLAVEKLAATKISAPPAEMLLICPHLSELLEETLPARYLRYLPNWTKLSCRFRRGVETIITYKSAQSVRISENRHINAEYVSEFTKSCDSRRKALGLSRREYSCAVLAASRFSNADITEILSCSEDSVKSCLKRAFAKLGIRSRGQLKSVVPTIER